MTGKNGVLINVDVDSVAQGTVTILSLSVNAWCEMSGNAYHTVALNRWQESISQLKKTLERTGQRSLNSANVRGLK
ncbi:MAG TPA: hypothetical protein VMV48_08025 [Gallionellaceae bacterium]|nr:hypothetical protein [Gallionellaceae bacterium]